MKTLYFLFFLLLFPICVPAQNKTRGIYKSGEDYKNATLSYVINCDSYDGKIKLHHFLSKNYIDIIKDKERTKLFKDSIFGYRDCKQNDYRFYKSNEKEYKIIENRSIVIYSADIPVLSSSGKRIELQPAYFFSTSLNGAIFPLTIFALKKAFPDNIKFHDLLDITFGNSSAISVYDSEHNMYLINFLLNKSLTN